jgi:hypothetical protein
MSAGDGEAGVRLDQSERPNLSLTEPGQSKANALPHHPKEDWRGGEPRAEFQRDLIR